MGSSGELAKKGLPKIGDFILRRRNLVCPARKELKDVRGEGESERSARAGEEAGLGGNLGETAILVDAAFRCKSLARLTFKDKLWA